MQLIVQNKVFIKKYLYFFFIISELIYSCEPGEFIVKGNNSLSINFFFQRESIFLTILRARFYIVRGEHFERSKCFN
jgi:hypothetical protein